MDLVAINSSTGIVNWPSPTAIGSPFTVTLQASSAGGCGISAPQSWQLGVVIGDFDGDGLVTINDITGLVNDLISASPTCAGDLNGDGKVDVADLALFDYYAGGNFDLNPDGSWTSTGAGKAIAPLNKVNCKCFLAAIVLTAL